MRFISFPFHGLEQLAEYNPLSPAVKGFYLHMATCAQDDHITKAHLRKQAVFQRPQNARVQRGGKTAQRCQGQAAEKPRLCARGRERWKSNPATRKASACQDGKKGKSSNKRGFSSSKRFLAQRRKAWVAESVVENVENFGTA